jgi:DNA-binding GntR family transcriptional regulator
MQIRGAITRGEITPGTKLRLDDLRELYGVSLSPLREALSRLGAEGFIVMEDQRGYRVAPVSEANLREVTRLRSQFECFALRESILHGDDEWEGNVVAALHRLKKLERAKAENDQKNGWEESHRTYHSTLIGACGMPLLLNFCATLHDLNDRYRRLFLASNPLDRGIAKEHEQIVDAATSRDADKACALMAKHIERTGANVLLSLQKSKTA